MLRVALVGASQKPSLSQRLFFRLQDAGFEMAPVSPNCIKLGEISCVATLADIDWLPDVVVFMVNPKLSLLILQQMFSLGIKKARFQPETFNPEVLDYCKEHGIDYETEKCLLVAPPEHLVDFVNTK